MDTWIPFPYKSGMMIFVFALCRSMYRRTNSQESVGACTHNFEKHGCLKAPTAPILMGTCDLAGSKAKNSQLCQTPDKIKLPFETKERALKMLIAQYNHCVPPI